MRVGAALALALGSIAVVGCSHSSESASRDTLTKDVGQYPPAPSGVNKPRVGVPPFNVQAQGAMAGGDLNSLAADEMTTLLDQSDRFKVIERAQLQKLLDEQQLEGIVRPGELAKPAQVRGVDYLLIGKVTNLRVKKENKGNSFGFAQIGGIVNTGGADVNNKETVITTECGVDIRLVDPSTGELLSSNFSEFKRTDQASSMGLSILGANAQSNADIQISQDDKGKILRLALDDALRKSLPKIDQFLRHQPAKSGGDSGAPVSGSNAPANNAVGSSNTGAAAPAGKKFCPNCGAQIAADAKFCPSCGKKVD
jgi:curli biogenesis system outer membrane secretion channel CsgG